MATKAPKKPGPTKILAIDLRRFAFVRGHPQGDETADFQTPTGQRPTFCLLLTEPSARKEPQRMHLRWGHQGSFMGTTAPAPSGRS